MIDLPQNTWQSLFADHWSASPATAPKPLQQWLTHEGSLTKKMSQHNARPISVQLLHQTLCFACADAALKLGVEEGSTLLHREVLLLHGETPLVFACSLLPEIALTGRYEELRQLEDRALDQWVFAEPALTRKKIQFTLLSSDDALFVRMSHLFSVPVQLSGRASYFEGAAAPLVVSEFFLPTFK